MIIAIPTALRPYANKQSSFHVEAGTVGEALHQLFASFPDLRKHLYSNEGKLRSFVNLYLNDDDIRYLQQEQTPVKKGDTLSIIPSIAGGK